MKTVYTIFFCIALIGAQGQFFTSLINQDTTGAPCTYDTTATLYEFDDWSIYQTSNDLWDGPQDSSCISLGAIIGNSKQGRIDIATIDPTRKVFVTYQPPTSVSLNLIPNSLFNLTASITNTVNVLDTLQTTAKVFVEVPDSIGTGTETRLFELDYGLSAMFGYQFKGCIVSEKHLNQSIEKIVYELKVLPGLTTGTIFMAGAGVEQQWQVAQLDSMSLTAAWNGSDYFLQNPGVPQFYHVNYLLLHTTQGYPNSFNKHFLEVAPIPNPSFQDTVSVSIAQGSAIVFQPHTSMIGALVAGDTTRHILEVQNNGALCLPQLVEVIWNGGTRYLHDNGKLDLQGKSSCFQFLPGSVLEVAANRTLDFGQVGKGILALRPGAQVVLNPGARLNLNHKLDIREIQGATQKRKIEIVLPEGSELTFGPWSSIFNANSIDGDMKLWVYLDGGKLDLSNLSPEDQQKIVVINLPKEDVTTPLILGNPTRDDLSFVFESRKDEVLECAIYDMNGRMIIQQNVQVVKGENQTTISLNSISKGAYLMSLRKKGIVITNGRFVKL